MLQHHIAHLFYLIRLGIRPARLQIQNFFNARRIKNVVAAAHSHLEPEPLQQLAQAVEGNIRIGGAQEDFLQKFGGFAHLWSPVTGKWCLAHCTMAL